MNKENLKNAKAEIKELLQSLAIDELFKEKGYKVFEKIGEIFAENIETAIAEQDISFIKGNINYFEFTQNIDSAKQLGRTMGELCKQNRNLSFAVIFEGSDVFPEKLLDIRESTLQNNRVFEKMNAEFAR